MTTNEKALLMHEKWNGKLETVSKTPVKSREDLAIAYTPGVAEPCKVIAQDKEAAYKYTMKANTVAVVSDGSAVLGLGNIGPYAAMPVMEGKAVLFKEFGNVNAVPICLDTQDTEEIIKAVTYLAPGFGDKVTGHDLIAYFQAYTNTYAPLPYLEEVYRSALDHPKVCGISIATRPDCLGPEVLALLAELKEVYPEKFLWIELGLQTIHEETARYIRRGYPLSCFEKACADLKALEIACIVHTILGLPGETDEQVLQTIQYLNRIAPFGVKLQLLHVLKNTDLAEDYEAGTFEVLTLEHYLDLLISCLAHLSPDMVIHRVTGDGPKDLLIAPKWSLDKRKVLNSLHHRMKEQGIRQGDLYEI